jgi:hypothetical protein
MGKKNAEVMAAQRARFVEGAARNKVSEKKAARLFELVEHFAGYGFPKAHSTTYALLAYQTAYLKANYPRHFAAALLTIEAANTDKLALSSASVAIAGLPFFRGHQRTLRSRHRRPLRPDRHRAWEAQSFAPTSASEAADHVSASAVRGVDLRRKKACSKRSEVRRATR